MSEVLFRAKKAHDGEWIYGYLVVCPDNSHRIYLKPFDGASTNTYFIVIPETVGQYTGFDAKGKKVFKGDILSGGLYKDHIVEWDNYKCGWNLRPSSMNRCYVSGNIYDAAQTEK